MVEVTQGRAYNRPLPRLITRDLSRYLSSEFDRESALWFSAEVSEVLSKHESKSTTIYGGLLKGRYHHNRIIGTTQR